MKRNFFILAVVTCAVFASCTNNDFVGSEPDTSSQGVENAITFGSGLKAVTRATNNTGATPAAMLDNHFKVLGVKNVSSAWSPVFVNYIVWNNTTATASNPDADWEYVGTTSQTYGADNTPLPSQQYIKYWDQSATNYHFVAGSPASSFTFNTNDNDIVSATVTGIAGHINANTGTALTTNPVYIAQPLDITKTSGNYNGEVSFNFIRQQSFVRVGVYETISGYKITNIEFYPYDESSDAWGTTPSNYITLASQTAKYFTGSADAQASITYTWTGTGAPKYTYTYESGLTQQKNWYGGKLADGVKATTSIVNATTTIANLYGTDGDINTDNGYFTVMPSASTTGQPILIKCNYTLESLDNSGEKINITNATAAIPADYTVWKPNTSYTYLFKITDSNLCPITFDAVVVAAADAEGTTTTVSAPSITVYQAGSVVTGGITYKAGAVTVTAMEGTTNVTDATDTKWYYVELASADFDYSKDYENLGNVSATDPVKTTWTSGKLTTVADGKTYIIKCTTANGTAYFVLVVGAAEVGPTN
ncbi:MAG: hypothetical protein J5486_11280 [Bacteroidaceae bacterium]|nr:hypothetical protein [Bacteroidaceae bacterium]